MSLNKKQIRSNFRNGVFQRDEDKCKICKSRENIAAHHITDRNEMPNGGYILENGITLCPSCHFKAEQFHINNGKKWEDGFHPNDLYNLINSSKQIAIKKDKK